ncbi:MAG: LysR family transcriptional regulator [Geminicoccaceae bacterium]|nr:LysR family transcriptional regulator [Geminicoccaceae bacterium]
MRMFVEAVDSGSFSAAGRRLGLAPSSIARGIGALEDQLGTRLLNRTTRKLSLTEAGRVYHEHSRRILAEIEEARLSVANLEAAPRGLLRISVPVVFGRLHVAPALPAFLRTYPDVQIDLGMTDSYVDLVEEGIDVAVRIGSLQDSSLVARKLAPTRRVLCASPVYFQRHGRPGTPAELKEHNCLFYKFSGGRAVWRFRDATGDHAIEIDGSLRTNNADALRTAALAGVGIVVLPLFMIGPDIKRGALEVIFPEVEFAQASLDADIWAVYPYGRHLSPKVRAFVDFLVRRFRPAPPWELDAPSLKQAAD